MISPLEIQKKFRFKNPNEKMQERKIIEAQYSIYAYFEASKTILGSRQTFMTSLHTLSIHG